MWAERLMPRSRSSVPMWALDSPFDRGSVLATSDSAQPVCADRVQQRPKCGAAPREWLEWSGRPSSPFSFSEQLEFFDNGGAGQDLKIRAMVVPPFSCPTAARDHFRLGADFVVEAWNRRFDIHALVHVGIGLNNSAQGQGMPRGRELRKISARSTGGARHRPKIGLAHAFAPRPITREKMAKRSRAP